MTSRSGKGSAPGKSARNRRPAPARKNTPARRGAPGRAVRDGLAGRVAGPAGALFLAGLMVYLACTVVATALPDLEIALGSRGTPGTAEVLSCESLGRGRYDCDARFTFDDPARGPIVAGTVPDALAGEVFPAALTPEGDRVVPTGARGVWASVGLLALAPFCLSFIPAMLLFGFEARRGLRASVIGACAVSALSFVLCGAGLFLGS
ncbi:hypothetical protein [Planomonospora venezuelensis]|uniref:Uncharacterized protein n=1 Tax=Planomonospora venezuelensis TaxID=1999 RepID=A0A841D7N5_PLAVE|nr:hypothetical protein [Planomonospora venezuelensis]MBB5966241.1 hypothetical protein [Planomonospora venezuelensis]GIM98453.1 hypothetical protein Pve01_01120 [Planomonospora venezuelensis]